MTARGGPQHIPRPPGVCAGGPAPWAALDRAARAPDLDLVTARLADAGPARPAPTERMDLFGASRPSRPARANAVLAPLFSAGGIATVVLTRRSWQLRHHTGEVSFPGGAHEEADDGLVATALREAHEEVGLDPGAVEVVGELDHLTTFVSGNAIVPYVGVVRDRPELRPSVAEVDAILEVPFSELLSDDVYREELWPIGDIALPMPFFELVGDTVWGATAELLRQLLSIATGLGRLPLR